VFGDELYDVLPQTRGGYGRLQDFGIRFGYERVVLHLEPQVEAGSVQCNTARTLLLLDHEPLPWARWGEEFAAAMPAEILRLQERAASADATPRQEAIRQRVTAILPLYRLSRYRPIARPRQAPIQPTPNEHNQAPDTPTSGPATSRRQTAADAAAAPAPGERAQERLTEPPAEDPDDEPRSHPTASLPDVAWISARDGSRAIGDLEDQAARYHPGRHELTINADFRAIGDHRPLAGPLPRNRRRPDGDRGTGARMVRTDPRRGSTRRVQLALDRGPTRRVAIAHLVHRHPVAQTPAARDTPDAARASARTTAQRCGRTGVGRKRHGAAAGQVARSG